MTRSEKHLFADGSRYISAGDAAAVYGFTRDYVGKLCRDGAVRAKRVGSRWFVSEESLVTFILGQQHAHKRRRKDLAEQRVREYAVRSKKMAYAPEHIVPIPNEAPWHPVPHSIRSFARASVAPAAITIVPDDREIGGFISHIGHVPSGVGDILAQHAAGLPVHTVAPLADFAHRLTALFMTFALIGGASVLVDPEGARIATMMLWTHTVQLATPAVLNGWW